MSRYSPLEVIVKKLTEKAALCELPEYDDDTEEWIPLSQIEDNGEDIEEGFEGKIYVSNWLLNEKGLETED